MALKIKGVAVEDFSWRIVNAALMDILCFQLGKMVCLVLSFGTYPDKQDFDEEDRDFGRLGAWMFGQTYLTVSLVGALVWILLGLWWWSI